MDSRKIATELERRYPSPPLHLDSPVLPKIEALIPKILAAMRGAILPKIPGALLNPPSVEYFERTRAERFGKPLAQVARESSEEKAWMDVEPVLKEIGSFLRAEGGPFVLGETGECFRIPHTLLLSEFVHSILAKSNSIIRRSCHR